MKYHEFQSITEEQWRAGIPRHRCAECSRDYGDPIHCATSAVSSWPLVVVIEDCYVPEWAGEIIAQMVATPVEHCYAVIHALGVYAEVNLRRERLN